jgi:hypothetical protein
LGALILGACLVLPAQASAAAAEKGCCWWLTVKAEGTATLTWPGDAFSAEQEGNYNYQGSQTDEWSFTSVAIVDYDLKARRTDELDERTVAVLKSDYHDTHKDLCRWERNFDLEGGPFGCWDRPCDERWRTAGFVRFRETLAHFPLAPPPGDPEGTLREYLAASAPQGYTFPHRSSEGSCQRTGYSSYIDLIPADDGPSHGKWDYLGIARPKPKKLNGTKSFNVAPKPWTGNHREMEHYDVRGSYPPHSSEAKTQIVFCFKYIAREKIRDAQGYLRTLADPQAREHLKRLPSCDFPA